LTSPFQAGQDGPHRSCREEGLERARSGCCRRDRAEEGALAAALGKDWRLANPLIAPILVVIVGLIAYPFLSSIWSSFQDIKIGGQGRFVGLGNYASLLAGVDSARFWNSVKVTFVYTGVVLAAKFVIGMTMALILHQAIVARDL
jgi:ABC-type sugar transport system permease subunit